MVHVKPPSRTAGLLCSTMSEHIDFDCSAILRGEMTLDQSGDRLLDLVVRTSAGRLTAASRRPDGLMKAAATPRLMQAYAIGR